MGAIIRERTGNNPFYILFQRIQKLTRPTKNWKSGPEKAAELHLAAAGRYTPASAQQGNNAVSDAVKVEQGVNTGVNPSVTPSLQSCTGDATENHSGVTNAHNPAFANPAFEDVSTKF